MSIKPHISQQYLCYDLSALDKQHGTTARGTRKILSPLTLVRASQPASSK
jgi:hypothetical protein